MKVIFLDIDGVMNSVQDGYSFTIETDKHFRLLKRIVDETGAKLVLSSTWRHFDCDVDVVENRLADFGMKLIGVTPWLVDSHIDIQRGDEIRSWLQDCEEEIESFVILDDDSDMREFTDTNLVQTDCRIGLTEKDVGRAIAILNK